MANHGKPDNMYRKVIYPRQFARGTLEDTILELVHHGFRPSEIRKFFGNPPWKSGLGTTIRKVYNLYHKVRRLVEEEYKELVKMVYGETDNIDMDKSFIPHQHLVHPQDPILGTQLTNYVSGYLRGKRLRRWEQIKEFKKYLSRRETILYETLSIIDRILYDLPSESIIRQEAMALARLNNGLDKTVNAVLSCILAVLRHAPQRLGEYLKRIEELYGAEALARSLEALRRDMYRVSGELVDKIIYSIIVYFTRQTILYGEEP